MTVAELIAELSKLPQDSNVTILPKVIRAGAALGCTWTPVEAMRFMGLLGEVQRQTLGLLAHGDLSSDEARELLGEPTNQALSGRLSGISKTAQSIGKDPRGVFHISTSRVGRTRFSLYSMATGFRDAIWSSL